MNNEWRIDIHREEEGVKDLKLRSILVDVLRGISVIAVLMAHSIQRGLYPSNYLDNYLVQLILPWYMT